MFSIIGAILFLVILVITILIILGLPFGEFIMGGQYSLALHIRLDIGIFSFLYTYYPQKDTYIRTEKINIDIS